MPSLSSLVDNFNDGVIAADWGNSYGGVTETGGRARVPCTTGYAGYQTAYSWTLAGAAVYVQIPTVPAVSTATEAYCGLLVNSGIDGTRIGFIINMVTGLLRCTNETGYFDAGSVNLTYSNTTHKWLRLREDGTNVYWDTSTDGSAWTNRRTLATPAWVTAAVNTCALDMSAHRDAGTGDFAEYDFFNTLSNGAVFTGTAALTADSALGAAATAITVVGVDLTADAALGSTAVLTAHAEAALDADSSLSADFSGTDLSDVDTLVGRPYSGWDVSVPWR